MGKSSTWFKIERFINKDEDTRYFLWIPYEILNKLEEILEEKKMTIQALSYKVMKG